MSRYRYQHKVVVVDAWRFMGKFDTDPNRPEWAANYWRGGIQMRLLQNGQLQVPTSTGVQLADIGDWIIKGIEDIHPCKDSIFRKTYQIAGPLEQPAPIHNDKPAIWDLVVQDMQACDRAGTKVYGTRLQPGNGRDALRDAYEEALDLAAYLRQAIYERDGE